MKKTILNSEHKKLNAKMVDFHNWDMPLSYSSIKEETLAVRNKVGIFDISHMGDVFVSGKESQTFIEYLITNSIADIPDGKIVYSPLCNEQGFIIDDILVYKFSDDKFLLIVNASNKDKDLQWLIINSKNFNVHIEDVTDKYSLIAVQGPESDIILNKILGLNFNEMNYYTFKELKFKNSEIIISRTGYTGEKGYEIFLKNELAPALWQELLDSGATPCGLGARDVLRIEAGLPLYGQELSEKINPYQAVLSRFVKLDKKNFISKDALVKFSSLFEEIRIGFIMELNRIARTNCEIYTPDEKNKIGWVSSGTFSFYLNKSIGMGFIQRKFNELKKIKIMMHNKFYNAFITDLPFIKLRVKER